MTNIPINQTTSYMFISMYILLCNYTHASFFLTHTDFSTIISDGIPIKALVEHSWEWKA